MKVPQCPKDKCCHQRQVLNTFFVSIGLQNMPIFGKQFNVSRSKEKFASSMLGFQIIILQTPLMIWMGWHCLGQPFEDHLYSTKSKSPFPYSFYTPFLNKDYRRHYYSPINRQYVSSTPFSWCEDMWTRAKCGVKCILLRKICDNATKAMNHLSPQYTSADKDLANSQSVAYANFKIPPYYNAKYYPSIKYAKISAGPNIYHAYPHNYWTNYYYRKLPYGMNMHHSVYEDEKPSISPYFTFPDQLKQTTTTEVPSIENPTISSNSTTTESSTTQENPKKLMPGTKLKNSFGKVTVATFSPPETEVQTLSPLLLDYDQYTTRGYYGDRIYMSAHMPVSGRQGKKTLPLFEDYDEAFFA